MDHSPPNCNYETFTIHTSSLGASSNTNFTSTFTRPIKDVVEASIIAASIRRPDVVPPFPITSTLVTSATAATLTHPALSRTLLNGATVTVTGHTGTSADTALNQAYTVVAAGSTPTSTLVTGLALPDYMTLSISQSVASSTTETVITFTAGSRQLYAGETIIITGFTAPDEAANGTFTVDSTGAPADVTAAITKTTLPNMAVTTYNTGTIVADTQPISGIYNTGTVLGTTTSVVAHTSNVVYIRAEELETDFSDFAAAGQPAVSSGTATHYFPTGSNLLRRCFGAIYDATSGRFSYKDRYTMTNQYIDPLHRLEKLQITLYDANGFQFDSTQSDGITYLTFRFVCRRKNLC